ncbi:hypothetical protein CCICO_02290 [Corynebacterium ciconiae DSM 44920]|nr:hypothetical protein CCICO_02290 [Corynebacterium ciconiae DSM 44920]
MGIIELAVVVLTLLPIIAGVVWLVRKINRIDRRLDQLSLRNDNLER